jgi:hypothetical protein
LEDGDGEEIVKKEAKSPGQ